MNIHPTAVVHPTASIGKDVEIGPYAIIGPDAVIGDRCVIGSHSVIEFTELGADCTVFPHACLGMAPQHLLYKGEKTKLVVGARSVFRESVTAHRGTVLDKGVTTIGNDCYFMALSHVAHDCRIGHNVILANAVQLAGHVEVGDHSFVSGTACVHQHVRLGAGCMVSGGAMVVLDIAPYCNAQGDRASLRGINVVGLKRRKVGRDSIRKIKDAYVKVFQSGLGLRDALATPELSDGDVHVQQFRNFLLGSKRGITRPAADAISNNGEEIS